MEISVQVLFDLPGQEKWAKPAQSGHADKQVPWPSAVLTARLGTGDVLEKAEEGPLLMSLFVPLPGLE